MVSGRPKNLHSKAHKDWNRLLQKERASSLQSTPEDNRK
jgi:hypothetical protein